MILSLFLIIATLGALLAYFSQRSRDIAITTMLVLAALGLVSLGMFSTQTKQLQFAEQLPLLSMGNFTITYHLGVDGISYPLVLLTILLGVVSVLVSRREIHTREGPYYGLLLSLVAAVIGVFTSLDLVLFFVFWEAVLVITFMLIMLWGGDNRKYAAMKFLLYTGLGSAALLLAIILLAVYGKSVDLVQLGAITLPAGIQYVIFAILIFTFFIKIPVIPFHTWLPDAHVQAPTAGSIMLAGVMLKMGAYGLLRFALLLHDTTVVFRSFLFWMGVATIIYGAWVCLAQRNLKKLIAYSSVNHMGFVLLGIAAGGAIGITGAVFEMVSHGLIAALLFALAGLIHERTGTFDIDALHGLVSKMPRTAWFMIIAALGGLGLPSMTGFIAEFLVLYATFGTFGWLAIIPLAGMILTGGYFLRMLAKAIFGKNAKVNADEQHVNPVPFALLLLAIFLLGILPFLLITIIAASVI